MIHSNCTNAQPLLYTAGNRSSDAGGGTHPPGGMNPTVKLICEGRDGKNRTRASRIFGTGRVGSSGIALPPPRVQKAAENTPADEIRNDDVVHDDSMIRPVHNTEDKRKRSEEVAASDEHIPESAKALEKGPVI